MKKIICCCCLLMLVWSVRAQQHEEKFHKEETGKEKDLYLRSFKKGSMNVSVGIGKPYFPSLFVSLYDNVPIPDNKNPGDTTVFNFAKIHSNGPFYLKGEIALNKYIGFALHLAAVKMNFYGDGTVTSTVNAYKRPFFFSGNYFSFSVIPRLNIHFLNRKKWDPYTSVAFGYAYRKLTTNLTVGQYTTGNIGQRIKLPIAFEATTGVRYYAGKNVFMYGEVGIAKSPVQVGLGYGF